MAEGRVALVTGGGRGLGVEMAKRLGRDGFRVAVNYFRSAEGAAAVVDEITAAGGTAKAFRADVTDEGEVTRLLSDIASTWRDVEVLVNNATGPQPERPLEGYAWQDFMDQINFFVKAPFMLVQTIIASMKRDKWGRIINIGTECAINCRPDFSPYVAAKSALHGLTKSWALEFAPWNITANLVAPGWVPTERHADVPETVLDEYAKKVPLGRLGLAAEVAAAVAFFAAEENGFVSAQRIAVNGANTF